MASFSIGEAYGAGFKLIAKRPVSVIAWGVVYTLINVLPVALIVWLVGPDFLSGVSEMVTTAIQGDNPREVIREYMPTFARLNGLASLSIITAVASVGIINAAIFRAVLRPEDKGFLGLKLGMDEVWQALICICYAFLVVFIIFGSLIGAAVIGAVFHFLGEAIGSPLGGFVKALAFAVLGIGWFVGMIWVILRFSLAGPATFANRTFQLFESWTLTKGSSWSLLGMALLVGVTVLIIGLVIQGVFLGAFFSPAAAETFSPEAIEAFFRQDPQDMIAQASPWVALVLFVSALLRGALYTIMLAPFASAYRQITHQSHAA